MSHVAKLIPMAMLALTISLPAQLGYASETDFSNARLYKTKSSTTKETV